MVVYINPDGPRLTVVPRTDSVRVLVPGQQGPPGPAGAVGGSVISGWWHYEQTEAPPPNVGGVRSYTLTGAVGDPVAIYIHKTDDDGLDWSQATGIVAVGDTLYVRDEDGDTWVVEVTAVTDNGTWTQLDTTMVAKTGTAPKKNARVQVSVVSKSSLSLTVHNQLTDRDAADAHPVAAITGLQTALDGKALAVHTHTSTQVTDATATGRAVLTAADAAAARAVIAAASAAEGALAATAVQPGDLATVATTGSYNDLTDQPAGVGGGTNSRPDFYGFAVDYRDGVGDDIGSAFTLTETHLGPAGNVRIYDDGAGWGTIRTRANTKFPTNLTVVVSSNSTTATGTNGYIQVLNDIVASRTDGAKVYANWYHEHDGAIQAGTITKTYYEDEAQIFYDTVKANCPGVEVVQIVMWYSFRDDVALNPDRVAGPLSPLMADAYGVDYYNKTDDDEGDGLSNPIDTAVPGSNSDGRALQAFIDKARADGVPWMINEWNWDWDEVNASGTNNQAHQQWTEWANNLLHYSWGQPDCLLTQFFNYTSSQNGRSLVASEQNEPSKTIPLLADNSLEIAALSGFAAFVEAYKGDAGLAEAPLDGKEYLRKSGLWVPLEYKVPNYTSFAPPANPVQGQMYYNSTLSALVFWNGSEWREITHQALSVPAIIAENTAEGGVAGSGVTVANSGGASGVPWTQVIDTSVAPIYTASALNGSLSYATNSISTLSSGVEWDSTVVPSASVHYLRFYFLLPALPVPSLIATIFEGFTDDTQATTSAKFGINHTNYRGRIGTASFYGTQAPAAFDANTVYRVEIKLDNGTGQIDWRSYLADGTAHETQTWVTTVAETRCVTFGRTKNSASDIQVLWDDVAISTTDWIGA